MLVHIICRALNLKWMTIYPSSLHFLLLSLDYSSAIDGTRLQCCENKYVDENKQENVNLDLKFRTITMVENVMEA